MTENALTIIPESGAATYRLSTDAAGLSRAIVMQTAVSIQGRQYVKVEGWQAIAVAHGCTASSGSVERTEDGFRAVGQVRRMDTGAVIAEAEGFVGIDEPVWFGGEATDKWGKKKIHLKRPDYAIRAMAQTRAISRACRSAFAHVVVMIDKNLSTTPAEEMQGLPENQRTDDWAEEAVKDGLAKDTTSTYDATKAKRAKEYADSAIEVMNLTRNPAAVKDWRRLASTVPEGKKKSPLEWLKDNSPGQYLRVRQAYQNATGEDIE